jgi:hypothetical protein
MKAELTSVTASNLIEINTSNNSEIVNKKEHKQRICVTKTLPPLPLPDVDTDDMDNDYSSSPVIRYF